MNRELKFRCWDKRHKGMFYSDHEKRLATFFDLFTGECCAEVIMQYTGLKDKNGKEIYEGDIVKIVDFMSAEHISVVTYNTKTLQFVFETGEGYYSNMDVNEVIGNIFENSNLLESENV